MNIQRKHRAVANMKGRMSEGMESLAMVRGLMNQEDEVVKGLCKTRRRAIQKQSILLQEKSLSKMTLSKTKQEFVFENLSSPT